MFVLPVIFLCNAVLFAVLLEERFKLLTTAAITAAAYIIAMIVNLFVEGVFADPAASGQIGNAVCVLILLLASVFSSSNNLAHKIFVALLLLTNYEFITGFVPHLLGLLPFSTAGIGAVLIANGIYLILSLLTVAIFSRPLHYFFRRSVSPSMVGLCLLQLLCWYVAQGGAGDYFATDSFPLTFFLTFFLYIVVIFCFLSIYGGAKHKAQDVIGTADQAVMDLEADSFNTMLVHINTYKTLKKNLDYQLDRIGFMARAGKVPDIIDYVELSKNTPVLNPLLADYCENPYLNAVVATKTAYAKTKEVNLESNVSLGDIPIRLNEVCVVINDLLAAAVAEAEQAETDDKFVRLNVMPTEGQLSVEAVYSQPKAEKERGKVIKGTVAEFLESMLEPKSDTDSEAMRNIMDIVEKRSGKVNISHSQGTVITRIALNY